MFGRMRTSAVPKKRPQGRMRLEIELDLDGFETWPFSLQGRVTGELVVGTTWACVEPVLVHFEEPIEGKADDIGFRVLRLLDRLTVQAQGTFVQGEARDVAEQNAAYREHYCPEEGDQVQG